MKRMCFFRHSPLLLAVAACAALGAPAFAQNASEQKTAAAATPVPADLPIPEIKTPLGDMPGVDALPVRKELPDPLTMDDGTSVTTPAQWAKRREEMKRTLEYYATGVMPPPPGNVKGEVTHTEMVLDGKVKYRLVHLTFGPESKLELEIGIFTPTEGGPFPTIIQQSGPPPGAKVLPRLEGGGAAPPRRPGPSPTAGPGARSADGATSGTAPGGQRPGGGPPGFFGPRTPESTATFNSKIFERGYALVVFSPNDCAEDTKLKMPDGSWAFRTTRFLPAYPGYDWGVLTVWAWGASRVADYLVTDPAIDKKIMIITGASRNGKSAMIAAAYDERLMGAPIVTGGGGLGAYRYAGPDDSETMDIMQRKYPNWFSPHLTQFVAKNDKLPFDQHWFVALAAPCPFIALEGDADRISWPGAVKASIEGAQKVYAFLGAPENVGIHYSRHPHAVTQEDWDAMLDFFDKYARGKNVDRTFDHFLTDAETTAARNRPRPQRQR